MTTRIDKVAVLGTGVLGSQIAYQTAYSGFDVTAYDISAEILEKARNGFEGLADRYEQEVEGASDDPETVDKAWRSATGAPHGPFQALDVTGLTTVYNIDAAGDEESRANARYLKEHYIDQGKLGRATGEGFYKYDTVAARS